MRTAPSLRPEWAVAVVVLVTAVRLWALSFDVTDVYTDESQYWFWGQNLDWGYFSKPPMVAWVSRLVTDLAGSNDDYWIRFPGALFQAFAALAVMAAAHRIWGRTAAAWAGVVYITLPYTSLGSVLYGTDSIMLPFYALGFWAYAGMTERRSIPLALIFGAATGLGLMSKYAAIYLPLTVALAALVLPRGRIALRDAGIAAAVALIVLSPNIWWNVRTGLTTVRHVVDDNANWDETTADPLRALEFLAQQILLVGPVIFVLLFVQAARAWRTGADPRLRWLTLLSWPIVLLIVLQAGRAQAYPNWAVTAYVAGLLLVLPRLLARRWLLWTTLGINVALAVLVPVLFANAERIPAGNGRLLGYRYLGRAEMSAMIADAARREGLGVILARDRGLLADLNLRLIDDPLKVYALPSPGRPRHFYEQETAVPSDLGEDALFIAFRMDLPCDPALATPLAVLSADRGTYRRKELPLWRVTPECVAEWRAGPDAPRSD